MRHPKLDRVTASPGANAATNPAGALNEPDVHGMAYPSSRRATLDELSTNFNSFALAGTISPPVHNFSSATQRSDATRALDLAQGEPTPSGSIGLGSHPQQIIRRFVFDVTNSSTEFANARPHAVRHVKSTGHSLNARFLGFESQAQHSGRH